MRKKPKYIAELLRLIFAIIGLPFLINGILSFYGIIKPKESSAVQVAFILGICFTAMGLAFWLVALILHLIVKRREKLCRELYESGSRLAGRVEDVSLLQSVQYGAQSPYVIRYTYMYDGNTYHRKSCYLWEKPNYFTGESIEIYARGGQSCCYDEISRL